MQESLEKEILKEELDLNSLLPKDSNMREALGQFESLQAVLEYEVDEAKGVPPLKGEFGKYWNEVILPVMRLFETDLAGFIKLDEEDLLHSKEYYYDEIKTLINNAKEGLLELPFKIYLKDDEKEKVKVGYLLSTIFGVEDGDSIYIETNRIKFPGERIVLRAAVEPRVKEPYSIEVPREIVENALQIDTKNKTYIKVPYLILKKK